MRSRLELALNLVIAASAIVVATVVVLDRRDSGVRDGPRMEARFEKDWRKMTAEAQWIGKPSTPVTIVEFTDYECPFCALFHKSLQAVLREFATEVSIALVPFPLEIHRHAASAAAAAQCADRSGRLQEISDVMYAAQDSLGRISWSTLAARAGVEDTVAFARCTEGVDLDSLRRTSAERASRFDVRATPTVIVNGWRFSHTPPTDTLRRVIRDILAGRDPY